MTTPTTTKAKNNPAGIFGLVVGLVGFLLLAAGGFLSYSAYTFVQNSAATTGQVISVQPLTTKGSTTYQPTFVFTAIDQKQYQGTTLLSSKSYNFGIGAEMDILYDTRDYSNIRLNSWFGIWGFGVLFLSAGVVAMALSKVLGKLALRQK